MPNYSSKPEIQHKYLNTFLPDKGPDTRSEVFDLTHQKLRSCRIQTHIVRCNMADFHDRTHAIGLTVIFDDLVNPLVEAFCTRLQRNYELGFCLLSSTGHTHASVLLNAVYLVAASAWDINAPATNQRVLCREWGFKYDLRPSRIGQQESRGQENEDG